MNKLRHQQLKAFYAQQHSNKQSQGGASRFNLLGYNSLHRNGQPSHQSNKDIKIGEKFSSDSLQNYTSDLIEDDPDHNNSQEYLFLAESANPVLHKGK